MTLHRLVAQHVNGCRLPATTHTPQIDGGAVYGSNEEFVQRVLRVPNSCKLRTSAGGMLPLTTNRDPKGFRHFIAGDLRVSEHAVLTAMHTIWLSALHSTCMTLHLLYLKQSFQCSSAKLVRVHHNLLSFVT
jgi:hypothetical protein